MLPRMMADYFLRMNHQYLEMLSLARQDGANNDIISQLRSLTAIIWTQHVRYVIPCKHCLSMVVNHMIRFHRRLFYVSFHHFFIVYHITAGNFLQLTPIRDQPRGSNERQSNWSTHVRITTKVLSFYSNINLALC